MTLAVAFAGSAGLTGGMTGMMTNAVPLLSAWYSAGDIVRKVCP